MEGHSQSLPPCRSVCERVKAGCGPIIDRYAFTWLDRMSCDQFPQLNNPEEILCMDRNLTDSELTASITHDVPSSPTSASSSFSLESVPVERDKLLRSEMAKKLEWAARAAGKSDPNTALLASYPAARLECDCNCRHPLVPVIAYNNSQLAQVGYTFTSPLIVFNLAVDLKSVNYATWRPSCNDSHHLYWDSNQVKPKHRRGIAVHAAPLDAQLLNASASLFRYRRRAFLVVHCPATRSTSKPRGIENSLTFGCGFGHFSAPSQHSSRF